MYYNDMLFVIQAFNLSQWPGTNTRAFCKLPNPDLRLITSTVRDALCLYRRTSAADRRRQPPVRLAPPAWTAPVRVGMQCELSDGSKQKMT